MGEIRKRKQTWWIRYYDRRGLRQEESSHSRDRQVAVDLLKRREGDLAKGIPVAAAMWRLRFEDAAADLVREYRVNGRRSGEALERRIRLGLAPVFGHRLMTAITVAEIRHYIDTRQTAGASNATINRELSALKRMFSLARQSRRLLADSVPHIALLEEDNVRQGFFEAEAFEAVCRQLPDALQPMVRFAFLTGWRVKSEILPLEWRQVDWQAGMVRLEPGRTKNREGRSFPFTRALATLLEAQKADHDRLRATGRIVPFVFHRDGARIRTFRRAWLTACRDAGVPGRIPHDFRRTAVRNLELAGVSRSAAMAMVGHKTESIYRRYAIVDADALRDAARKLDQAAPVDGRGDTFRDTRRPIR